MFSKTIIASTLLAAVSAHQNFHQFWVNDVSPGYQAGIRMPPSNSPVTDVTSNDMACNVGGSKVPSGVVTVAAAEGDTIKVQWDQSGHPGPITHMLFGPVDDASQATGIGSWVKIDELNTQDGKWASEIMGANNMTHTFKLPTGLKSGEYLLRSEMLALHGAQTSGGAQFYIGCAQLKITGTGSGACSPSIKLPGAYNAEDPNIFISNFYNGFDLTTYTAPGGPVASCGGSGSSSPVSSSAPVASKPANDTLIASSTAASAPTTAVAAAPSSSVAAPSTLATFVRPSSKPSSGFAAPSGVAAPSGTGSADSGSVAKKYYQCGGSNWTGATTCESGATCKKHNEWYSQCV
ncbi:hypothetical protein CC80DRAFT_475786 [Byssothecium circinans]|uniref:AA9 family lytic polysaccharide monooxygenase n=1 Tax=Byssothecium circinans TaxID=147558 RepID=A0A6A5TNS7_9PLEO|nr:hypothetical protein CC80DRAFT_475786 [Byssothecium circinans]